MHAISQLIALCVAMALAACSIDASHFRPGGEDCAAAGDEDGDGMADCGDPACAGAPACSLVCGDGVQAAGEGCDDGNTVTERCAYGERSCMVCDTTCRTVAGVASYCGDRALDPASRRATTVTP